MKKIVLAVMAVVMFFIATQSWAHNLYVKKNPTNENGIEFGVDNASGFVSWRAYVSGTSNNSRGQNSGWTDSGNGWWYYNLSSPSQRVMWRLDGLANQTFVVTYWVFRSDGTWEYGAQQNVISDQLLPTASFSNLVNGQTKTSLQFPVNVLASDNLSGVAAVRVYVVVPAGQSLSGWTASGLANQYYKEYTSTSIGEIFYAPVEGNYVFTLWVKDQAGNICYEPGGQIKITVDLDEPEPPPPVITPPAAPTNLQLSNDGADILISWQDNATDEDGYKLYRNDELVITLPANSNQYTDLDLEYGPNYCYDVIAYKSSLNSPKLSACLLLEAPPAPDLRYADGFSHPLDCLQSIHRISKDDDITKAECFDYQPFGSLFVYQDKVHLGADLNLKGIDDKGAPVYAIANGLIWEFGWTSGWGNYLFLQVTASPGSSFLLISGKKTSQVYVFFAHLDEIYIKDNNGKFTPRANIVAGQTYVGRGWQIGTVGDCNGKFSPHLHLEVRTNGYTSRGIGYYSLNDNWYLDNFTDPVEFIYNNWYWPLAQQSSVIVHGYDTDPQAPVFFEADSYWQRHGRINDGAPLASVGWNNNFWLTSSSNKTQAVWHFEVPYTGTWSVFTVVPRYYSQANGVHYQIYSAAATPTEKTINQANDDENLFVLLGDFNFYQGQEYKVVVASQTTDNPAKLVGVDSLKLIYEGDLGAGGGEDPGVPVTITTSGSLTFMYQGSYLQPELHCAGAGLAWQDLILSVGQTQAEVSVSYSDTVLCNIEFEDGNWLANWQGKLEQENLLVNGQKITALQENGQGGYNLVFGLTLTGADHKSGSAKSKTVSGNGCSLSNGLKPEYAISNWLMIMLPMLIVWFGARLKRIRR